MKVIILIKCYRKYFVWKIEQMKTNKTKNK